MSSDKIETVEYLQDGKSLFTKWFNSLDAAPAARVTTALYKLESGNFLNVKSAGRGVMEHRIDSGPGYRIYFGRDGDKLIILLGGGRKRTQSKDIDKAQVLWRRYKADKKYKGR